MNLEEKVKEGGGIKDTTIDLIAATLATIGAYNLAGHIASITNFSDQTDIWLTIALLSIGAIGGYKIVPAVKKIKNRGKKGIARAKILKEMSKDEEFLERQGLTAGNFGKIRKGLKYLLTVPLGGALGYLPGAAGVIPLCVYFAQHYNWHSDASLGSGPIAGPIISAYAFAEMTFKKQYKRLITTAFSLAGISVGHFLNSRLDLDMFESDLELWTGLGICATGGLIGGLIGNKSYKIIRNLISKRKF